MPFIELHFLDGSWVVIFATLFILLLLRSKAEINLAHFQLGFSVPNSVQAQGFLIVIVILHHISQRLADGTLANFKGYGYLAVGVFFLLSGYGLAKSISVKKHYLRGFLRRKFTAVVLPFLVLNILTTLFIYFFYRQSWQDAWLYLSSIWLIDTTSWFIVCIFIFYVAFYLAFHFCSHRWALLVLLALVACYVQACIWLSLGNWVYKSAFCFPLGVWLGTQEQRFNHWICRLHLNALLVMLAVGAIAVIIAQPQLIKSIPEYWVGIIFAIASYLCLSVITLDSPISHQMGSMSLEIYLLHMKLLWLFSLFTGLPAFLWCICYFFSLFLLAYGFRTISHRPYFPHWHHA